MEVARPALEVQIAQRSARRVRHRASPRHYSASIGRLGAEAERIVQIIEARLRLTEVFARIAPA
jgi:hypothetical protein